MKLTRHVVLLFCAVWLFSSTAHAGLLRYDMNYRSLNEAELPSYSGYMLFSDAAPLGGNIWPDIVDWHFDVGGFIFNSSNTAAATDGYFQVNALGNVVTDFTLIGPAPFIQFFYPCFSNTGSCEGSGTYLGFQSFVVGTFLQFPGSTFASSTLGGTIIYSGPRAVPVGGSLMLVLIGLVGVITRGIGRGRIASLG